MAQQVYKVYNFRRDTIDFVAKVNDKTHEVIEEIEVPDNEDIRDFLDVLRNEVYLGDSCETAVRYGKRY